MHGFNYTLNVVKSIYFFLIIIVFSTLHSQVIFNGNLETHDSTGMPVGWELAFGKSSYQVTKDSAIRCNGKYSATISQINSKSNFGAINHPIKQTFHGKFLTLKGILKSENVDSGYAGLWLRVDGKEDAQLALEDMSGNGIKGTTEWKEYVIQVPYKEDEALVINAGALLSGCGKIWVDSLRLYVDSTPIEKASLLTEIYPAQRDTAFEHNSGIISIPATRENITRLSLMGQLWGFIKYHHPSVAKGNYNMDAELFRVLPKLFLCKSNSEASKVMELWVDKFGRPLPHKGNIILPNKKSIVLKPSYGDLFNNAVFSKTLTAKLNFILTNRNRGTNYYIKIDSAEVGNPVFTFEKEYDILYPDVGYRLLALYRYWNIIQYFFPSRHITGQDWKMILPAFIRPLIEAKDAIAYTKTMLQLNASIHDTHAFFYSKTYEKNKGRYRMPFQAKFIEGKLTVTGYYTDAYHVKEEMKPGDIITSINGTATEILVRKYRDVIPASNIGATLRDMPGLYLLRSNDSATNFQILRNRQLVAIKCTGVLNSSVDTYKKDWNQYESDSSFTLLDIATGYIFAGKYKNNELSRIKQLFENTRGIIVDMRTYPSDEITWMLGNYLKPFPSFFANFSMGSVETPGMFTFTSPAKNGDTSNDHYRGKVAVIVNEMTQSNAEFVTMALQSNPKAIVVGSTSAGADGNISKIILPGGITTFISGLGVFYMDGTNAQRRGVKINYVVKPTIAGIKAGKDELLEKTRQIIFSNFTFSPKLLKY